MAFKWGLGEWPLVGAWSVSGGWVNGGWVGEWGLITCVLELVWVVV
jgi:hypothetical protein